MCLNCIFLMYMYIFIRFSGIMSSRQFLWSTERVLIMTNYLFSNENILLKLMFNVLSIKQFHPPLVLPRLSTNNVITFILCFLLNHLNSWCFFSKLSNPKLLSLNSCNFQIMYTYIYNHFFY